MDPASAHAAVIASPREDAPRERFADLVAASEPATAAFVRAQLAVAVKRRNAGRRDRAVEAEARRCLAPPEAQDARGAQAVRRLLGSTVPAGAPALGYGRGFAERAVVDAAWFAGHGPDLMALAPVLDVTLHNSACDAEELFDSPAWAHVRSLRFTGPRPTAQMVTALASSPYLGRLAMLDLSFAGLPTDTIHTIAASRALKGLRYLVAPGNLFPDVNRTVDEDEGGPYGERESRFAQELAGRYGSKAWFNGIPSDLEPDPESFP